MSVRTTTIDDGLTVVSEHMPDVRSASVGFWVGTGSVDEAPAEAGASHFLEHLLFKGTAERSARSISDAVDAIGGDINAFTTKEYTTFYVRLLAEDVEMGVDLLSDIFWSPAFRPPEVESERQVILEEILMHADDPGELVHEVLAQAMFPSHALGREVLGEQETISAMTVERIRSFHAMHYRPGNLVVAAAGRIDHDRIVSAVAERTPRGTAGSPPQRHAPEGEPSARTVLPRPTEQAHIAVGLPGPTRDDEDRHALSVIDHVLGGGMSSRLFQAIREERGLAYAVYSFRSGFQRAGLLGVYAGTSPSNVAEVVKLVEKALQEIAVDGITDDELRAARGHMLGSMALGLEDSGARMSRIGYSQLVHGRVLDLDEIDSRLRRLAREGVNEVAGRWFSGSPTIACVGPFDPGREVF